MSYLPFHQKQLNVMTDLARNRVEFLDPIFLFLNYFDSPYFFFILIPVIWLGYSYKWGLRIYYWVTFNSLLIGALKGSFGWNRPSTDMPEVGMLHPKSFGFPSGGAQTAIFLGGILIYYWRTPAAWAIGIIYILLISFSRFYLGVHYPLDILGGWLFGAILICLFVTLKDPLERFLIKKGLDFSLFLSLAIPLLIFYFFPETSYMMGAAVGVGLGTYFSLKNRLFLPVPKNLKEGIGRSFIGIAILFIFVLLIPGKEGFFHSLLSGAFMSLAVSPICRWFIKK